jgi:hypothetical protein
MSSFSQSQILESIINIAVDSYWHIWTNRVHVGGNRYFITFIDDFSKKLWVYFLKEKSVSFIVFKNFKALVENQSGYKLVNLRSNRGGEYTSRIW